MSNTDVLLTIGSFSKMTYLSVKALHHYHDVGLLEPAVVDTASGYRHYSTAQGGRAQASCGSISRSAARLFWGCTDRACLFE